MALRYYANAAATTLAASVSALATTISVASATGLPAAFPYTLIIDRGTPTEEAVEVTAAAGVDLTVTRGADATTAFSHTTGAEVVHGITARDLREPNTHINSDDNVHGVTGNVVGTTDAQSLTNKDMSSETNTLPQSVTGYLAPTGAGMEWYTTTPPAGWLLQDGSAVSRTTYADLFAVIGTTYGAGDGSTTFNLPNRSGRVGVGLDINDPTYFNNLGEQGGSQTHTLTTAEMPAHAHGVSDPSHGHSAASSTAGGHAHTVPDIGHNEYPPHNWSYVNGGGRTFNVGQAIATDAQGAHTHTITVYGNYTGISIQNAGGGGAHPIIQPYTVVNYIIKT